MKKLLLIAMAAVPLVMGCSHSKVPNSKTYWRSEQQLMSAARHWDELAMMEAYTILSTVPPGNRIYLDPGQEGMPFGKAFHTLLTSQLVSSGARVMTQPTPDSYCFSFDVQVIEHPRQGYATHSPADFFEVFIGREAPEQKTELLITTRGAVNDQLIMSDSQIYYFYGPNVGNYKGSARTATFAVTDN